MKKETINVAIHEVVIGRADCPNLGFVNAKGNEYDGWLCAKIEGHWMPLFEAQTYFNTKFKSRNDQKIII